MFSEFSHRHTSCTVDGIADKVILSRDTKSASITSKEYMFIGRFSPTSSVNTGSMVIAADSFLVESLRITPDADKYCSMVKTNVTIDVWRYSQPESGDPDFFLGTSNVKGYVQFVRGDLRKQIPGLLATTEYILIVQNSVDVKNPVDLYKPDRIAMNGKNYQVDVVDDVMIPNLHYVQLSEDNR